MNFLYTLAAFALALGVLIIVHEYGHYLVARLCGVKVLRFSVGFGKPLVSRRFKPGGTEWVIAAFPLGGYVKMLDEHEGEVAPHELALAFNRQPVWRRMLIVAAGPFANFLLAIAIYWILFMAGVPGIKPVLGDIPPASAAASASFQTGEMIAKIAGQPVASWEDVRWLLLQHVAGKDKKIEVEASNQRSEIALHHLDLSALTPDDLDSDFLQTLGLQPLPFSRMPPRIGEILPQGAAARAGLKPGDTIVASDDRPVATWESWVKAVRQSPGRLLKVEIERQGARLQLALTPEATDENGKSVGKIGAGSFFVAQVRYGAARALTEAVNKCWDTSLFSLKMFGKMVAGQLSLKNISGPITIADYAGQTAHMGWMSYIGFLALISISLGVLNLLPVPLLDGGHLLYYIVEIIKGSPVSEKIMAIGQQIGMALLLMLMVFAFYNDINRLISNG